jgi:hypothetical protein
MHRCRGIELRSPDYQEVVFHYASEGPPIFNNLGQALCACATHRPPPPPRTLGPAFPRLIEKLSQLWKGRVALPGEEGGAVKLEGQECGKE